MTETVSIGQTILVVKSQLPSPACPGEAADQRGRVSSPSCSAPGPSGETLHFQELPESPTCSQLQSLGSSTISTQSTTVVATPPVYKRADDLKEEGVSFTFLLLDCHQTIDLPEPNIRLPGSSCWESPEAVFLAPVPQPGKTPDIGHLQLHQLAKLWRAAPDSLLRATLVPPWCLSTSSIPKQLLLLPRALPPSPVSSTLHSRFSRMFLEGFHGLELRRRPSAPTWTSSTETFLLALTDISDNVVLSEIINKE